MDQKNSTPASRALRVSARRLLNLEALRTFAAVCETRSFRGAALRVYRSPSAVSLQIGKLEEELGAQLFVRDARKVEITESGERLWEYANRLLDLSEEAASLFRRPRLCGRLRVAAAHDLGASLLPALLKKLADLHPDIVLDVQLSSSQAVERWQADGSCNVALFNASGVADRVPDCLYSEPLVWVMRRGGRAIEIDPLPLAMAEVGCPWRDAALGALRKARRPHRVVVSSDTVGGQVAAARADLVIAALPKPVAYGQLQEVPSSYGLPVLPFNLVRLASDGGELAQAFARVAETSVISGNTFERER